MDINAISPGRANASIPKTPITPRIFASTKHPTLATAEQNFKRFITDQKESGWLAKYEQAREQAFAPWLSTNSQFQEANHPAYKGILTAMAEYRVKQRAEEIELAKAEAEKEHKKRVRGTLEAARHVYNTEWMEQEKAYIQPILAEVYSRAANNEDLGAQILALYLYEYQQLGMFKTEPHTFVAKLLQERDQDRRIRLHEDGRTRDTLPVNSRGQNARHLPKDIFIPRAQALYNQVQQRAEAGDSFAQSILMKLRNYFTSHEKAINNGWVGQTLYGVLDWFVDPQGKLLPSEELLGIAQYRMSIAEVDNLRPWLASLFEAAYRDAESYIATNSITRFLAKEENRIHLIADALELKRRLEGFEPSQELQAKINAKAKELMPKLLAMLNINPQEAEPNHLEIEKQRILKDRGLSGTVRMLIEKSLGFPPPTMTNILINYEDMLMFSPMEIEIMSPPYKPGTNDLRRTILNPSVPSRMGAQIQLAESYGLKIVAPPGGMLFDIQRYNDAEIFIITEIKANGERMKFKVDPNGTSPDGELGILIVEENRHNSGNFDNGATAFYPY